MEYKGFIYAPTPKTAWDNLSMQKKSEMMKVAVRNGITDLKTIREKYNEFAEGRNLSEDNLSETNQFGGGGYVPSRAIRQRIANWEGAAMDRDTIDPLSGKVVKKNRSFEEVATGFVNAIPKDIRGQVLGNQELADNLYSYAYNVGPGKFKERVVPALRRYYQGNGSVSEVTDSMWASGDKKLRGLRRRRTEERSGVSRALQGDNTANPVSYTSQTDNNGFVPFQPMLPEVFEVPHPVVPYSIADTPIENQEVAESPYDIKVLEGQRRRDNLQRFMNVLNMVYGDNTEDEGSFFLPLGALGYNNTFEGGGKIYIKPKNRGKFTALKERTGHSATWFKEHGTPAQKKMATFELNARHWKHGLGGNLFDNGGDKDNIFKYTNNNGDVRYVYQDNSDAEEVPVRPLNTIFPDPAQWTFTDDAGKFYTPRRTAPINMVELNPDNRTGFERALDNYIGEAFNTVPKGYHTLPAISAATFGLAYPTLGRVALTSGFGAHGLSKWMNGEIHGPLDAAMTALEIAPLGQLAKPALSTLTPIIENEGFALTNPITGNINWVGRGIGSYINVSPTTDGWLGVDYINSIRSGVGRKLYDAAIKEAHKRGLNGVKSGVSLASAPKTYNIWNHYPNRTLLSTTGSHGNGNMINGEFTTKVDTPEGLIEATTQGIDAAVIGKAPVYGLTTPSNNVPFLSFSRTPRAPQITAENTVSITPA